MSRLRAWVKGGNSRNETGFWLSFDYDLDTISKIKETIPSQYREWNPDKKEWWVSEYCEKQINDIFKGFLEMVRAQKSLF